MEGLNIYEMDITNKELEVTYTPNLSVQKYNYEIYKDGELYGTYQVSHNKESIIKFNETGTYKLRIVNYLKSYKTEVIESGEYTLDLNPPVIAALDAISVYKLKEGDSYGLGPDELNVRAYDTEDGNLTNSLKCNLDDINFNSLGIQKLTCSISDSAGNITTKDITINVVQGSGDSLIFIQIFFLACLMIIVGLLLKFRTSMAYAKRLNPYSLESVKQKNKTFANDLLNRYHVVLEKMSGYLKKSVFIERMSNRYDKYVNLYGGLYHNGFEFISEKIIVGCIFILIAIFSKMLSYQLLGFTEMLGLFIVGYFIPDLIYITKYKGYRSRIENDLFQAIIIMNNAFKSGRSITQAIDLVSTELDGPIALEFKKMSMELNLGLSVDTVFKRLSSRVQLEEVTYLTASLSILNKTGGNIIKVFTSIEKNLFNKKKLRVELKSLTGTSKVIVTVLYLVPIMFILFISLVSPGYFETFYTTEIGFIFMMIILVLYIIYIYVVNKVMKVRM